MTAVTQEGKKENPKFTERLPQAHVTQETVLK